MEIKMTAKQRNLLIDKGKTYISLALVLSGAAGIIWVTSDYTNVKAEVRQNTQDIQSVHQEIKSLSDDLKITNNNLTTANENVVRLTTLLEQR
jgi:hypothetical protein